MHLDLGEGPGTGAVDQTVPAYKDTKHALLAFLDEQGRKSRKSEGKTGQVLLDLPSSTASAEETRSSSWPTRS